MTTIGGRTSLLPPLPPRPSSAFFPSPLFSDCWKHSLWSVWLTSAGLCRMDSARALSLPDPLYFPQVRVPGSILFKGMGVFCSPSPDRIGHISRDFWTPYLAAACFIFYRAVVVLRSTRADAVPFSPVRVSSWIPVSFLFRVLLLRTNDLAGS